MNQLTQLETRLSRLEQQMNAQRRSLRRSRAGCAVLGFALLGTIGLASAAHRPIERVIQAHRFEVIDENNQLVAALDADQLGGKLDLWTSEGRNVLRAATSESGGDITIWNADGAAVYGAYATTGGSETAHWNAHGRPTSVIIADEDGGHLRLQTDQDQTVIGLTSTARGGAIETFLANGDRALTVTPGDGGTMLMLHDAHGRGLTRLTAANGAGEVRIDSPGGSAVTSLSASDAGGTLTVRDRDGRHAGSLIAGENGGQLALRNRAGQVAFHAAANAAGGSINLNNAEDVAIFHAGAGEDRAGGFLRLFNHNGERIVTAGGKADGTGQIAMFSGKDTPVFSVDALAGIGGIMALMNDAGTRMFVVGTHEHGGLMNMMNASGVPILVAGYSPEGRGGAMMLNNARGIQVIHVGTDTTESGTLHLWDADGKRQRTIKHAE